MKGDWPFASIPSTYCVSQSSSLIFVFLQSSSHAAAVVFADFDRDSTDFSKMPCHATFMALFLLCWTIFQKVHREVLHPTSKTILLFIHCTYWFCFYFYSNFSEWFLRKQPVFRSDGNFQSLLRFCFGSVKSFFLYCKCLMLRIKMWGTSLSVRVRKSHSDAMPSRESQHCPKFRDCICFLEKFLNLSKIRLRFVSEGSCNCPSHSLRFLQFSLPDV